MTLRTQINLLIALLLGLFLGAVVALEIDATRRSIREELEASTRITLQLLGTVIADAQARGAGITPRTLAAFLDHLGRVRANDIELLDAAGNRLYQSPQSHYKQGRDAPAWFVELVAPAVQTARIRVSGGMVTITPDPSRSLVDAWDSLSSLLWLALAFFACVHVLVFWLAGRALAPLSAFSRALQQVERGEFHARVERFSGVEFGRLADTFNRMAQAVEESFSLRRESARRAEELRENRAITALIQQHVEEERRALARELHDELGQGVTAVRTIASSIAHRARERAPELETNALAIVDVAGQMYDAMHDMVRQLRPIALDNLGLADALRELAASSRQRTPELSVDLVLRDELDGLDEVTNITAYRIVQECLTNVARHAGADTVTVVLGRSPDGAELEIEVRDNGRGMEPDAIGADRMGVRGMRERVHGLGGSFVLESSPGSGVQVRVRLPIHEENPA
ncbi:MAG: HAMP domain-containing protein [Pseudomonadota bacterium]|nr:HAMP domain-containing protein [Pseudomonadota bacterium]